MKKLVAKLIAMAMVAGMLPVSVFAAGGVNVDSGNQIVNNDTYNLTADTAISSIVVEQGKTITINGGGHQVYATDNDTIIATVDGTLNLNRVYLVGNDVILVDGNKPTVNNGDATARQGNLVTMTLKNTGSYTYVLAADAVTYDIVTGIIGGTVGAAGKTWTITENGVAVNGTYTIANDAVLTLSTTSGGGGGGGGGTSSGGSSSSGTSNSTANVSTDSKGNVSTTAVNQAVESLVKSESRAVTMAIDAGKSSTVTLPNQAMTEALATLSREGKSVTLSLTYEKGKISLSADALSSVLEQAGSKNVSISLDSADTSKMTQAKAKAVGDAVAVDLSITAGSQEITSFGGASVSVSLNFTTKYGVDTDTVQVWYVKDNGGKVQMSTSFAGGKATFETTHFSTYMVGYEPANTQSLSKYRDVTNGWYYHPVQYVVYYGIMSGTDNNAFAPDMNLSRAMVAQMIYQMAGKPAAVSGNFRDVAENAWYADAVNWAASQGIVAGYAGEFAPDRDVTRQELATMLMRYADYKGYDRESGSISGYPDVGSVASWAMDGMEWAVTEGVISGVSNGSTTTLSASATATRAQAAAMFMRADGLVG